jgi:hypothetical protein
VQLAIERLSIITPPIGDIAWLRQVPKRNAAIDRVAYSRSCA